MYGVYDTIIINILRRNYMQIQKYNGSINLKDWSLSKEPCYQNNYTDNILI